MHIEWYRQRSIQPVQLAEFTRKKKWGIRQLQTLTFRAKNKLTANNKLKKKTQYLAHDNSHSAILIVISSLFHLDWKMIIICLLCLFTYIFLKSNLLGKQQNGLLFFRMIRDNLYLHLLLQMHIKERSFCRCYNDNVIDLYALQSLNIAVRICGMPHYLF